MGTVPGQRGELFAQDPVSASCPERPWGVAHPQSQAQFVQGRTSVCSPYPLLCWDIRLIRKTLWKNDVLEIIIVLDSSGQKKKKNHYL